MQTHISHAIRCHRRQQDICPALTEDGGLNQQEARLKKAEKDLLVCRDAWQWAETARACGTSFRYVPILVSITIAGHPTSCSIQRRNRTSGSMFRSTHACPAASDRAQDIKHSSEKEDISPDLRFSAMIRRHFGPEEALYGRRIFLAARSS